MRGISLAMPLASDRAANLQRIRLLRYFLPLALFLLAGGFEVGEHWLESEPLRIDALGLWEIFIFGIVGPSAVYAALSYVQHLLGTVQQAHAEIEQLNRGLEQKVFLRTAELQAANAQLREMDQMKSDFVSLVSHELRAPLATLNGGLEVALQHEQQLPAKAQRILHLLLDETARLTQFVQTILDVTQLKAGRLPLNYGPVAVRPMLTNAVNMALGPHERRVVWQVSQDVPPVWVDEVYTEQVFRNLLRNALKYTPSHSPVEVNVSIQPRWVTIAVVDYGPGIAAEHCTQVFDRFVRLPQDGVDRPPGWGLGLHFARVLLASQGGTIDLVSPAHADPVTPGCRFVVTLPIAECPPLEDDDGVAEAGVLPRVAQHA